MKASRVAATSAWIFSVVLLACAATGCAAGAARRATPPPPPVAPAVAYLDMMQAGIDRARAQMPTIIESAQQAAKRINAGGRLFVAGSQPEFARALVGRSGGLQALRHAPVRLDQVEKRDVILYAARSTLTPNDSIRITRWRERGVLVIAFASARLSSDPYFRPDVLIDSGDTAGLRVGEDADHDGAPDHFIPTDTAINLLNAWTWTGEFISASTRLGPPPVVRDAVARGRPELFTGVVGMTYLDRIEEYLSVVRGEAPEQLRLAGAWVRGAGRTRNAAQVASVLFPEHFNDERAAQPFGRVAAFDARAPQSSPCLAVIGNGEPPQLLVAAAQLRRSKLIYASVPPAADAAATPQHVIRLPAPWPIEDRCVRIEGYEGNVLPATDVLQPALYWALVAEAVGGQ